MLTRAAAKSCLAKRYDVLDRSWDRATPLVINARHRAHLVSASQFLSAFLEDRERLDCPLAPPTDPDLRIADNDIVLAAEELRYAARAVGRITGRIDVEDVLDVIFRDFCIGK